MVVELRAGELRLALRPDMGGSIASLKLGDVAVLRSCGDPAALSGPRQSACFPLVPYSNRLGFRRFRWHGRDYTTEPNFDDATPHSLHGVAWRQPWQVEAPSDVEATLRYEHEPDAHWPFALCARQRFALGPRSLDVSLSVENRAAEIAPIGLGWHPYLPRRARSRIALDVAARWDVDAAQLPIARAEQHGIEADVDALAFDHCFDGWSGRAGIDDDLLSIALTSSLRRVVVFTPRGQPHFCIEPVSHVNNAINMADPLTHGIVALAPGECASATMRIEVGRRTTGTAIAGSTL